MKKIFNCVGMVKEWDIDIPEYSIALVSKEYRAYIDSNKISGIEDEIVDSHLNKGCKSVIFYDNQTQLHVKESFEECCEFWDNKEPDFIFNQN